MEYKRNDGTSVKFTTILEDEKTASAFRHFKNKEYKIVSIATYSEDGSPYVVYKAMYGEHGIYVRPAEMFFSEVDHEKYPDVLQKYRFELVE